MRRWCFMVYIDIWHESVSSLLRDGELLCLQVTYQLCAVVCHHGPTLCSVHYSVIVKDGGRWLMCDDRLVLCLVQNNSCVSISLSDCSFCARSSLQSGRHDFGQNIRGRLSAHEKLLLRNNPSCDTYFQSLEVPISDEQSQWSRPIQWKLLKH